MKDDELDDLQRRIASGEVEILIADGCRLERHGALVDEFLLEIVGHPEALITDLSELTDFSRTKDYWAEIMAFYGVNAYGMNNIADILDVISESLETRH